MSKLDIIVLIGVVYGVKIAGLSTEPCETPYDSVTLSDIVSLIFTIDAYFSNKKKTKFETAQISHTNMKVYLLM